RYPGFQAPLDLIDTYHLGGVILFGPNIDSLTQVQTVAQQVQELVSKRDQDWPAIVAVDNEGGQVQRLSGRNGPWSTYPPFSHAEAASPTQVTKAMRAMGRELRASGINTNYAPV